jgi:hypothetical protein
MGRPRKRRRDDVLLTSEEGAKVQPEKEAGFAVSFYSDIGLISPNLDDFSGYGGFQADDGLANGLLPNSFSEAPLPDHFNQSAMSDLE